MNLAERAEAALLPTYPERPLTLVRGVGSTVFADDGSAYLDMVAGLAVCSLGHGHPSASAALAEQAATLGHVSNLFYSEPQVALAERLAELAGFGRAFLCNSGAEAVEAGIKLARRCGRARGGPAKHRIVCIEDAFHGRTLATLAAGWSHAKREPFAPVPAGFEHVPRNDIAALEAAVGPETAAVLLEPIQGEGGVWPLDDGFLLAARALCDRHGALLVFDEVQTGIGRCGSWFRFQRTPLCPMRWRWPRAWPAGCRSVHCSPPTSPTASSAATTRPRSAERLRSLPRPWPCWQRSSTKGWSTRHGWSASAYCARLRETAGVAGVRGAGLLLAVELADLPSAEAAARLRAAGVLVNAITPTALRLCPPLCLTVREADRFCDELASVLATAPVVAGER